MTNQSTLEVGSTKSIAEIQKYRKPLEKMATDRSPYEDVSTFHCPNCDGYRFNIFRDNIYPHQKKRDIAGCLDCHAFTYVYKLKNSYNDDLSKDFEIWFIQNVRIDLRCGKCKRHRGALEHQVIRYHDMDSPTDDPPLDYWECSKHPKDTYIAVEEDVSEPVFFTRDGKCLSDMTQKEIDEYEEVW